MIGNTICADLLDYLYRDWYHVGKPRTPDDRIFQYMEIRRSGSDNGSQSSANLERHVDDRFVIALGQKTKIRTDGISAILGLLEWRYDLAEMVLFHHAKLAAGAMLDRALHELWEGKDEAHLIEKVLPLSDDQLLDEATKEADKLLHDKPEKAVPSLSAAASLLRKLRDRNLFRELTTFDATNLAGRCIVEIKKTYAVTRVGGTSGAKNRADAPRLLETDFNLPAGSIAIYCSHIKSKIAEVSIAVDSHVMRFNEYEEENRNRMSGGHLEAQIERFERLWRIYFFIDAQVEESLPKEKLLLLKETVGQVVLAEGEPSELLPRSKEKALHYVHQEKEHGNNGIEFSDNLIIAARGDSSVTALRKYPNGAPSMTSFIREK